MKRFFVVVLALVLVFTAGLNVMAASVEPQAWPDNHVDGEFPGCTSFKPHESLEGMGSYFEENDGALEVSFTITDSVYLEWSSNIPVSHVFVKGGTGGGGNIYTYDSAANGDAGLHALGNKKGKLQDISHVVFFYCQSTVSGEEYNEGEGSNEGEGEGSENGQEQGRPRSNYVYDEEPVIIVQVDLEEPAAEPELVEDDEELVEEDEEAVEVTIEIQAEAPAAGEPELPQTGGEDMILFALGVVLTSSMFIRRKRK